VRTVLTALVACLFVVMITADRFACPDGCTDEAPTQAGSEQASAACAICHGWNETVIVAAPRPAPRLVPRRPVVSTNLADPALPAAERPPKDA
jgi:cytochrome c553